MGPSTRTWTRRRKPPRLHSTKFHRRRSREELMISPRSSQVGEVQCIDEVLMEAFYGCCKCLMHGLRPEQMIGQRIHLTPRLSILMASQHGDRRARIKMPVLLARCIWWGPRLPSSCPFEACDSSLLCCVVPPLAPPSGDVRLRGRITSIWVAVLFLEAVVADVRIRQSNRGTQDTACFYQTCELRHWTDSADSVPPLSL